MCHTVYVEVRGQVDTVGSPTMWFWDSNLGHQA